MKDWESYGRAVESHASHIFGCARFSVPIAHEEWDGTYYLRFIEDEKAPIPLTFDSFGHTAGEMGGLLWLTTANPIPWGSGWSAGMVRDGKRRQFIQNLNTQLSFEGIIPGKFLFEDQVWDRYEASSPRASI